MPRSRAKIRPEPPELAEFVSELEELRLMSGLSNVGIAKIMSCNVGVVTRVTRGADRPSWRTVAGYVEACGGDVGEWKRRWDAMNAAVDHHRRAQRQTIRDIPYEEMEAPSSPFAFNCHLQKRICREDSQRAVVRRAHYEETTASTHFNSNRIAPEKFTRDVLVAAGADNSEIAVWMAWRAELVGSPDEPANSWRRRSVVALTLAIVAVLVVVAVWALPSASPGTDARFGVEPTQPGREAALPGDSKKEGPSPVRQPSPAQPSRALAASPDLVLTAPNQPAPNLDAAGQPPMISAKILGDRPANGTSKPTDDTSALGSGQEVKIVCMTIGIEPRGWYYTAEGYFVHPESVQFVNEQDAAKVSGCAEINFLEYRVPQPNPRMRCVVQLMLVSCIDARSALGKVLR